jgi:hypothetical protein
MTIMNRRNVRLALAITAAVICGTSTGVAQIAGSQRGWAYQFDIRQAEGRTDRLGLDFDVQYESQQEPKPPTLDSYGFTARAQGFNTFDRATRDVNSLIGEIALLGWRYRSALLHDGVLPPEQILELERLLDKSGSGATLKPEEQAKVNAFNDRLSQDRRFFTYGGQFRWETTADAKVAQNSLGLVGATEIPFLGKLLDALPASTRSSGRRSFPVRALIALDYVRPAKNESATTVLLDTATWRARTEMAWSSVVLDRYIVRATWEAHYFINPPAPVRTAKRQFNNFLQAWLKVPITPEMGVVIKYLSGRIPPTYDNSDIAALGFNIAFFP